jgi:hypothetical protein
MLEYSLCKIETFIIYILHYGFLRILYYEEVSHHGELYFSKRGIFSLENIITSYKRRGKGKGPLRKFYQLKFF